MKGKARALVSYIEHLQGLCIEYMKVRHTIFSPGRGKLLGNGPEANQHDSMFPGDSKTSSQWTYGKLYFQSPSELILFLVVQSSSQGSRYIKVPSPTDLGKYDTASLWVEYHQQWEFLAYWGRFIPYRFGCIRMELTSVENDHWSCNGYKLQG